jgi:hypothetical protein
MASSGALVSASNGSIRGSSMAAGYAGLRQTIRQLWSRRPSLGALLRSLDPSAGLLGPGLVARPASV